MIPERVHSERQSRTVATIAIIAAFLGLILTFSAHPFWGFLINLTAIVLGLVGVVMAASPRVSGGIMSIAAIILGVVGAILSIVVMVGVVVF